MEKQVTPARVTKVHGRVTRLGELLPIGRLFTFGSFYNINEVAQSFVLLYPMAQVLYQFRLKMALAIFWAIIWLHLW
jgi:hypothetical protein